MTTTVLQLLLSMRPGNQTQNCCTLLPRVDGGHCSASRGWEHETSERELVLMVDDEMCFFLTAAQRQTSGLTACADPFTEVCNARQEPRHREAGRRKRRNDHDPRTPRKGRLRPGKLQLNPIRCSFHLLPILVYRKGHLCGISMPLSPSRRLPSTATPRGRPPQRRNVTTPACRGRAASGVTLAVLDLHCATNVLPELCTLGFCSLPVCLWKVGVLHDAHGPEVLAALAEPDAPHSRKARV